MSLSVLILSRTKDIHWEIPETTTSKFCLFEHRTQLNTHLLTYLFQETLWTRTLGCLGQSFMRTNKGKEEGQIWLPVSLTSCLSASMRFAVESCSNYISFQYFVFLTQSKYYQIQGHGASEPEIVQGWLPGVSPPLHPKYVFFFLKKFQLLANSHHHRFPGFAELQKLAGPWVTRVLCK